MKRKVIIVAFVTWVACLLGGGIWGRFEQYLHTRSITPGQAEIQDLKDLYDANLFNEVLSECDRADNDPHYADYKPQILYIRWATDRRLDRSDEAEHAQQTFLRSFPDNILGADMHFATAINLLATLDYDGAMRELEIIHARYPNAAVAPKAADVLYHLRTVNSTSPAQQRGAF